MHRSIMHDRAVSLQLQVVFVATANQLQNMSGPLLDRLEIIQLSGYTLEEKRHIAEVAALCCCLCQCSFLLRFATKLHHCLLQQWLVTALLRMHSFVQ